MNPYLGELSWISPTKPSGGTKEFVCFEYAVKGQCPLKDKCKYDHDLAKAKAFLHEQNRKVLNSPHWDQKDHRLAAMVHNSPHFERSFNKPSDETKMEWKQKPAHVLGVMYREQFETENEMYEEEHERLLDEYVFSNYSY